jgi:hypothetical protein
VRAGAGLQAGRADASIMMEVEAESDKANWRTGQGQLRLLGVTDGDAMRWRCDAMAMAMAMAMRWRWRCDGDAIRAPGTTSRRLTCNYLPG